MKGGSASSKNEGKPLAEGGVAVNKTAGGASADETGNGGAGKEGAEDVKDVKEEGANTLERFKVVDRMLSKLDDKSTTMATMVQELQVSLEYSQNEIEMLKKENKQLRAKLGDLETEESRTNYQMKKIEDKVDKVETVAKKKNLIFEGVSEVDGGREEVNKTVWLVLDQLKLDKEVELDSCYRVGSNYNKNRPRPIIITFVRQADRDLIYSRRTELRKSESYKHVWINEDLGPSSKKTRNMIRLIARQAQNDGVDFKTGKYSIQVNKRRYDENSLEELPTPLKPTSLKQVQIDSHTIAYQSELAPFSNFYPAMMRIGKHQFSCLEQAFQFTKAKTLDSPLAATRIFLSRDPVEMKRIGGELGTSEAWEKRKFDIMYICLKHKFEQNDGLRELLLNSGNCELVEATPGRLWGSGATLSSNLLRRHEWPGENKQGKILMTIREELRKRAEKGAQK